MKEYQIDNNKINIYSHFNESNKKTILFLHGAGMSHAIWYNISEKLIENDYNLVIPDMPAHGKSSGSPISSISDYSKFVGSIIKDLKLKDIILVGHSMGGLVALDFAINNPSNLSKLILLGTTPKMPVHPKLLDMAKSDHKIASEQILNWSVSPELDNHIVQNIKKTFIINDDNALFSDLSACNDYILDESKLDNFNIETLIISGENDQMTPVKHALKFEKLINNSSYRQIDNSGHMMMAEFPDKTLDIILNFL